jgi:hypothetical protein
MPCPSHSASSGHPNIIWWAVKILELLIMYFSSVSYYFLSLRHKYLPQHPTLEHSQSMSFL